MLKSNIRQYVATWNNRFPLDKWWRKKYNVPFLSKKHRESTFFSMYAEFYEELMYKEYSDRVNDIKESNYEYSPMSGNWWKGIPPSEQEIDDWFNSPI